VKWWERAVSRDNTVDQELKQHLEAVETRINAHADAMEYRLSKHIDALFGKVEEPVEETGSKLVAALHKWTRAMETGSFDGAAR
jgi:hypothetical protein